MYIPTCLPTYIQTHVHICMVPNRRYLGSGKRYKEGRGSPVLRCTSEITEQLHGVEPCLHGWALRLKSGELGELLLQQKVMLIVARDEL